MDPNATLESIRELVKEMQSDYEDPDKEYQIDNDDANSLTCHVEALDKWLCNGGFLPKQWTSKPNLLRDPPRWDSLDTDTDGEHVVPLPRGASVSINVSKLPVVGTYADVCAAFNAQGVNRGNYSLVIPWFYGE